MQKHPTIRLSQLKKRIQELEEECPDDPEVHIFLWDQDTHMLVAAAGVNYIDLMRSSTSTGQAKPDPLGIVGKVVLGARVKVAH